MKSVPISVTAHTQCACCSKQLHALNRCAACNRLSYCSTACQSVHWKQEHKAVCKIFRRINDRDELAVNDPEREENWVSYVYTQLHILHNSADCGYRS